MWVRQVRRLAPVQFLRNMLGMFNLTDFEKDLIEVVREKMEPPLREIFDDQLSHVHRVDRVINERDDRLDHGRAIFYRRRKGASKQAFPKLFPPKEKNSLLAKILVAEPDAQIEVYLVLANGGFIGMEFFSIQRRFHPHGPYEVKSVELFPAGGDGLNRSGNNGHGELPRL
jgi:hypothetical protein